VATCWPRYRSYTKEYSVLVIASAVHTAGVNWEQALAIWVPIVTGLLGIIGSMVLGVRSFKRWREAREDQLKDQFRDIARELVGAVTGRLDHIENHLGEQDKRLNRIDRNTGTDST
jgi:hypothetical protein